MPFSRRLLIVSLVASVSLGAAIASAQQSSGSSLADILIVHARAYTVDSKQPWAQSIALRQGKIIAVGSDQELAAFRTATTRIIDARGKLVLPAFTDSHIHFIEGGFSLQHANLEGAKDVAEIQQRLRAYVAQHRGQKWILGGGWNYTMFGSETLPNKKDLDQLFPDTPVLLDCYDGHTSWANSKALSLAGITKSTPNPPNGIIVRDSVTGEPTGALKESAGELVSKIVPQPTRDDDLNAIRAAMKWANQNGLARVHSAGGDFEHLDLYQQLRDEQQLTIRFHIARVLDPTTGLRPEDLDALESARKKFHDEWIDANSVKFFMDGVVEAHTAAFLEPYTDEPSTKGSLFWDPGKYKAAVAALDAKDFQLYTHAIGDYAVRTALDAYEYAEQQNHTSDHRNRIEHIETITASDIPRFAKLGVIASMQPLHAYPDEDTLDVWARNIGPDRASRAWVWKSIALAGGRYAFGSDWPVVTLNPWEGIQTAVTRQTSNGKPAGGFVPSQRLTVAEAVAGYTIDAAFAGRLEKTEGSLEVGKVADVIMLDRNIFDIDPHTIDQTKVLLTIVGGKIVYDTNAR
ncbi:MAG TPA: amidohydrolase family protein [Candidatus Sulfotelmatobacter sp.]|nr:amidohydrolase family protein [Candidatus Sulfotelmatobacter sp.]